MRFKTFCPRVWLPNPDRGVENDLGADGGFMRAIGETFDGEKSLPYVFDTIVRLYRDKNGRFMGECLKDRSGKLPLGEFENSMPNLLLPSHMKGAFKLQEFALVPLLFIVSCQLAAFLPGLRVRRMQPVEALRVD